MCVFLSCCFSGLRAGPRPADTLGDVGGGVPSGFGQPRAAPAAPQRASLPAPLARHTAVGEAALGQAATPGPSLPAGCCAQDQAPVTLKGTEACRPHATAPTLRRPG